MCKTTTHQETAPYETQRDRETDVDDTVLLYNDECILLEKFYTNTEKSLVSVEQKVVEPTSYHSNDCSGHITNLN